jgi:AcrR family transcriptional regulator
LAAVPYHHGNLRPALVEAATGLLKEAGPLGVTLRGTARRAGVSRAAPYRHFRDRGALLAAVAEAGFQRLERAMTAAAARRRADPIEALLAMCVAIVRFAAAHPSHYRLMCGPAVRGRDHPSLRRAARTAWRLVTDEVRHCQEVGQLRPESPIELAFVLWCALHGLAVLLVDEQLPPDVRRAFRPERLAAHVARRALDGLRAPASWGLRIRQPLLGRRRRRGAGA